MKTGISFDVDGTLLDHFFGQENKNKESIQNLLVELVLSGLYNVYIVTRRFGPERSEEGKGNEHLDVYELLKSLNT